MGSIDVSSATSSGGMLNTRMSFKPLSPAAPLSGASTRSQKAHDKASYLLAKPGSGAGDPSAKHAALADAAAAQAEAEKKGGAALHEEAGSAASADVTSSVSESDARAGGGTQTVVDRWV